MSSARLLSPPLINNYNNDLARVVLSGTFYITSTQSNLHFAKMAAFKAGTKTQGNSNRRLAVPVAIPLTYTQKRSMEDGSASKNDITTTVIQCLLSPPTSPPITSHTVSGRDSTATTNGTLAPSLDRHTQVAEQTQGQSSSSEISEPETGINESIESSENGLGRNRNTTAANPGKNSFQRSESA